MPCYVCEQYLMLQQVNRCWFLYAVPIRLGTFFAMGQNNKSCEQHVLLAYSRNKIRKILFRAESTYLQQIKLIRNKMLEMFWTFLGFHQRKHSRQNYNKSRAVTNWEPNWRCGNAEITVVKSRQKQQKGFIARRHRRMISSPVLPY